MTRQSKRACGRSVLKASELPALLPGCADSEMPYGVVMASAGAGQVAALNGIHGLALLLTVVAASQALLIPIGHVLTADGIGLPRWRHGLFTIALGLAVLAGNLHSVAPGIGIIVLGLAGLVMLILGGWWIARALTGADKDTLVDGTWFLAPAALLGFAGAVATAMGAHSDSGIRLLVAACLVGVIGYAWVLAESARRLVRHGLQGSPLAPWWISAGCGGLAAATLAKMAGAVSNRMLDGVLSALMAATWLVATVLLIAVLTGCLRHAWRRSRGRWTHVWAPVFSSAVYAAGTEALAQTSADDWLHQMAVVSALATLGLWLANTILCGISYITETERT